MKNVLIVDDEEAAQRAWARTLQRRDVRALTALTIAEARRLFVDNPDVDAIVMDGNMGGDITTDLVVEMRRTYRGPIIANSGCSDSQEELIAAGCDHRADKTAMMSTLLPILGVREVVP